jgi:hypothetical protein
MGVVVASVDVPPRNARVLTIIEAADGTAWVQFFPDSRNIAMTHDNPGTDQYELTTEVSGAAHVVVAASVERAMQIAVEYWAATRRNSNQQKGLTR